jgi:putative YphP/YqiW family bacilliredoxin
MPYPEEWVKPAREELTSIGVQELKTTAEVDEVFGQSEGSTLLVINSICGCAAANARPAVAQALKEAKNPDRLTTVFAGQDLEATARAREYLEPQPASSPSIALLRDGKLVFMLHRHQIEGRESSAIAKDLRDALNEL